MSSEIAVSFDSVSKYFQRYSHPSDRLKQFFFPRFRYLLGFTQKEYYSEFWALKNATFNIKKGEIVGVIGPNGAGKSTLLQILCGTLSQTAGKVVTNGRVSALLELGSGFNPEFSGIENIYLNGSILGLSRDEIESKINEIINFADIGDFVYQPVKTYSSGMYARLALAVAVNVEPDILIIDETLSVGDLLFQAKAIHRMRELMNKCTVLFVSHSLPTVKSFCNRALLIERGQILRDGPAADVCDEYETMMHKRLLVSQRLSDVARYEFDQSFVDSVYSSLDIDPEFPESRNDFRSGSGELYFLRGDLLVNGLPSSIASLGDEIRLRLVIQAMQDVKAGAIVGYMVRNANAIDIFGCNTFNEKLFLDSLKTGQKVLVEFAFVCNLSAGRYSISIGTKREPMYPEFFDSIHVARTFEVRALADNYVPGIIYLKNDIKIKIITGS